MPDTAKTIKDAAETAWASTHPTWGVTLHIDDDYQPSNPVLLVADDGGPPRYRGAWMVQKTPRNPTIRLTGFAKGRSQALAVVNAGVDFVVAEKPGIARIEDISDPLITRDRETGAFLASITMPVIVRPNTS